MHSFGLPPSVETEVSALQSSVQSRRNDFPFESLVCVRETALVPLENFAWLVSSSLIASKRHSGFFCHM